ncbi:MAG: carbohydrate diacid transcriptional activator CdaR [Candidatus Izimaplasma bacterium HR2]|nr:MAG: carbohydrate diacid transcriptional activator CdaR [Candidatus Izimaplasma bacterium HR2]
MKRKVFIYQESISEEIIELFSSLGSSFTIESVKEDVITLLDNDYYNPEPIDLGGFSELILEDFDSNITMFLEPYFESEFVLSNDIKSFIKEIPHGVYYFEDIVTYSVVRNNKVLKKKILDYINKNVNSEVVHTVLEFIENNMNSSSTSKKLYMHRNTLNYRIDNFIETTKINVKTFKGANAVYLLYKY